jgi:hypothetical protein
MAVENSFEHQGIVYNTSKKQMAKDHGVEPRTFWSRLNRGLSMEEALSTKDKRTGNTSKRKVRPKYWCTGRLLDHYTERQQLLSCRRWSEK